MVVTILGILQIELIEGLGHDRHTDRVSPGWAQRVSVTQCLCAPAPRNPDSKNILKFEKFVDINFKSVNNNKKKVIEPNFYVLIRSTHYPYSATI